MTDLKAPPLCDVEILAEHGRFKSVVINGHRMRTIKRGSITLTSENGTAVLKLELWALDVRLRGKMAVELVNAPPGSRMLRDEQGRCWLEQDLSTEEPG